MVFGAKVLFIYFFAKNLGMRKVERWRLDVLEIKCLWSLCEASRTVRERNEEVKSRVSVKENTSVRVVLKVLSLFGYVDLTSVAMSHDMSNDQQTSLPG